MLNQSTQLDYVFSAFSDPSRRAMIERLGAGPATVSELAEPLHMSLAAVVQHVQVLDECGVISTEKVGRVRTCRLNAEALDTASKWIASRQEAFWRSALRTVGGLLKDQDKKRKKKGNK